MFLPRWLMLFIATSKISQDKEAQETFLNVTYFKHADDHHPGSDLLQVIADHSLEAGRRWQRCGASSCPHCQHEPNSGHAFRRHASRPRTFLVIDGRFVREIAGLLIRWRCPTCGRTFTDYPAFAVPHRRYALSQMASRAFRYIDDKGMSYRKAVLEFYLPVFHANDQPDATTEWGQDEATLSHSTLYHWVSVLGGIPPAETSCQMTASFMDFEPASWKFFTAARRDILITCRYRCLDFRAILRG